MLLPIYNPITPSSYISSPSVSTSPSPTPTLSDDNPPIYHYNIGGGYNNINMYKHEPKIPHLIQWLSISKLLDEFSDDSISNESLQLIMHIIFSNRKEMIKYLCKNVNLNQQQLNNIYQILKNDMNNNGIYSTCTSHIKSQSSIPYFNILSTLSIANICSYLTKTDILSFKNTCITIAIQCLNEMKKCKIRVFNMTELLLYPKYNNFATFKKIKITNTIKNERYLPSIQK
eukprot:145213_1